MMPNCGLQCGAEVDTDRNQSGFNFLLAQIHGRQRDLAGSTLQIRGQAVYGSLLCSVVEVTFREAALAG
jgi:hypothetical protein